MPQIPALGGPDRGEIADRGFSSLPVVLLLSAVLAFGVVAVGVAGLGLAQRSLEKQRLLDDFYQTCESIAEISGGGERFVQIKSSGKIVLQGWTIEAQLNGETLKAEMLPAFCPSRVELTYGCYLLSVGQDLTLEVTKWKT